MAGEERKPGLRQIYRNLSVHAESLDARRVSAFVAVSTLFVVLLASSGGEWVSFATFPLDSDCDLQSGRMRSYTLFPKGIADPSDRIHVVDLYPDAFLKEPALALDIKDPTKLHCPDLQILFSQVYGEGAIRYDLTYQGLDSQLPPVEKTGQFPEDYIRMNIALASNQIESVRTTNP